MGSDPVFRLPLHLTLAQACALITALTPWSSRTHGSACPASQPGPVSLVSVRLPVGTAQPLSPALLSKPTHLRHLLVFPQESKRQKLRGAPPNAVPGAHSSARPAPAHHPAPQRGVHRGRGPLSGNRSRGQRAGALDFYHFPFWASTRCLEVREPHVTRTRATH